jgi:hypothetical protein
MVAIDKEILLKILASMPDPTAKLSEDMIYIPIGSNAPIPFKKIKFQKNSGSHEWMYAPCFLAMLAPQAHQMKPSAMLIPYVDEEVWEAAKKLKADKPEEKKVSNLIL